MNIQCSFFLETGISLQMLPKFSQVREENVKVHIK